MHVTSVCEELLIVFLLFFGSFSFPLPLTMQYTSFITTCSERLQGDIEYRGGSLGCACLVGNASSRPSRQTNKRKVINKWRLVVAVASWKTPVIMTRPAVSDPSPEVLKQVFSWSCSCLLDHFSCSLSLTTNYHQYCITKPTLNISPQGIRRFIIYLSPLSLPD